MGRTYYKPMMWKWSLYSLKILNLDRSLTMHLLCVLILLTSHSYVLGVEYGPSISSLTGVFVNWRGPDIFSVESGRKVKLENFPGFACVIPLITGDSKASSEQIFQERGISTVGEFVVEAPRGFGIMAVVQELKLRKTTREGASNVTCSDYIQIGDTRSGAVSSKICGIVNRDDPTLKPEGLLGPRTFRSSAGRLRIAFNHAYVAELVDSLLGSKQKHILRAEVAFTAYKVNCFDESTSINSTTTTTASTTDEDSFEVCSDYTSGNQTCISSKLLCDEIYNCGGDGETLGSDDSQSTCPDKPIRTTTEKSPEEDNPGDKQDGLGNLASYLGIPSLSSFTTRKYERKFRPYVSSSSQFGSGSSFEFNPRKSTTDSPPPALSPTPEVISSENSNAGKASDSNSNSDRKVEQDLGHETEIYNRRELSHAINSVIYGVAVFIIFTIFITVFVVCITKKIQTTLSARSARNSIGSDSTSTSVSTPSIIPTTTTTVITHNRTGSNCSPNGDLAYAPANTTVVLLTLPQSVEQYDPPPSYDTLFPEPGEC